MKNKQPKIGTIITQDIPQVSSLLSTLGYDFIFIDLEHGSVSDNTIAAINNSKTEPCQLFIRINAITESSIKHALDLGSDGIIAPRVETINELQTLVDFSYYPPIGKRSVGFSFANKFGLNFKEYTESFKPIILVQIESTAGLQIANDIITHERIDGIFIGPYDLSMSMGLAGQFDNPEFQNAVQSIRMSCRTNNKFFGTFAANETVALSEIETGCDLIAIGVDSNLLLNTYQVILKAMKSD